VEEREKASASAATETFNSDFIIFPYYYQAAGPVFAACHMKELCQLCKIHQISGLNNPADTILQEYLPLHYFGDPNWCRLLFWCNR